MVASSLEVDAESFTILQGFLSTICNSDPGPMECLDVLESTAQSGPNLGFHILDHQAWEPQANHALTCRVQECFNQTIRWQVSHTGQLDPAGSLSTQQNIKDHQFSRLE